MFSVKGSGTIDDSGKYVAAEGTDHLAAIVTAKVGELEGQARIRSRAAAVLGNSISATVKCRSLGSAVAIGTVPRR